MGARPANCGYRFVPLLDAVGVLLSGSAHHSAVLDLDTRKYDNAGTFVGLLVISIIGFAVTCALPAISNSTTMELQKLVKNPSVALRVLPRQLMPTVTKMTI